MANGGGARMVPACCVFILLCYSLAASSTPLVIWHGMGDTCCDGLSSLQRWIEEAIPGIYVRSLMVGDSLAADRWNSFFLNVNYQVEWVCEQLKNDPQLSSGFNAIGFSQGGQFLRALVQRCGDVRVLNLITVGSQHQGVYGFPFCAGEHIFCDMFRRILSFGAYFSLIQNHFVQAEYWHDPLHESVYQENCVFLPDLNQEVEVKEEYKKRLSELSNLVMVKFLRDHMVQPAETEWFGFYKENQSREVYSLFESQLYQKDLLGLKVLNDTGRLHLLSCDSGHLQLSLDWFTVYILPFLY